ncbi:MAG: hypothetical protein B1H03_00345 [Planctomycetales bacterium 4484_113]|nr:MAG: hypothetical protein B1H03_00345 [Planctomycetales bacterium 4484_113]
MKRILLLVLAVVIIAAFVFWRVSVSREAGGDSSSKTKGSSDYEEVKYGDLTLTVEGTGIVEPRTTARVKSEATGIVEELYIKEGDEVEKGDLIARLDQEDQKLRLQKAVLAEKQAKLRYERVKQTDLPKQITVAQARVDELKLSLTNAEDRLGRVKQLATRGYASDQEVEDAQKAVDLFRVQLDEAETSLELLKGTDYAQTMEAARLSWEQSKVDLAQARKALGDATIVSPIDGTVLAKYVEEGDTVISSSQGFTEGTTICTVADLHEVQVRGSIDEVDIGTVEVGQKAELTVDPYPDRVYEGTVTNIFPQGEKQPGGLTTFTVMISVANEDRSLLANMTAAIKIKTKTIEHVLLVPFAAIRPGEKEGEMVVFVRQERGIPKKTVVKLGVTDYENYEVLEGLQEGDEVKIKDFPREIRVEARAG